MGQEYYSVTRDDMLQNQHSGHLLPFSQISNFSYPNAMSQLSMSQANSLLHQEIIEMNRYSNEEEYDFETYNM